MIKLGRSFWWLLILTGISFLVSRLPGLADNLIYTRLSIALGIIIVVNGLWAGLSIIGIDFKRESKTTRRQVGDIFSENFEIVNRSIIPKVWLKITDQSKLPGTAGSRVITGIGGRQSRAYIAYSYLRNRGWYLLGPTTVDTGDVFGLFRITRSTGSASRLLVIPFTFDIKQFPAPFGTLPGGRALREKTLEVTPYAAGVREYVPGDPLKRIHWPSSARKQKLIVKEFEKDPMAEVWLFFDARGSEHVRVVDEEDDRLDQFWWVRRRQRFELPHDTEEYAVAIAASISKYYIRQKREVGLVTMGQSYTVLPPERGERQLGKILETLAVLRAEGEMPLWGLISTQVTHLTRGSTIVLVTPSTNELILNSVIELVQRGLMPVVILIDGTSFGGKKDPAELEQKLIRHGIMTFKVSAGDDIQSVLETPNLFLKYPYH